MVSYERLWKTMEKKGISQYRLINHYKISAGQIGRMKKNMHVSTHTLEVFCNILQCPVEDIVEVIWIPRNQTERNRPVPEAGRLEGPQPGPGMPKKRRASPEIRRLESQDPDPESREPERPQQLPEITRLESRHPDLESREPERPRQLPEITRLGNWHPDPESREPGRPQQSPEKSWPERQKTVLAEKRLGRLRLVPERETSR